MNQPTYALVAYTLDKKSIEYDATYSKPDEWYVYLKPKNSNAIDWICITGDMTLTQFMEHVEKHKRLFP